MSDKTLEQLEEQMDAIKVKLQAQVQEIVDITCNDLPEYVLKNVRRAFIEDVEYGEKKSDRDLAEFKVRVRDFGQKLSQEVRTALLSDMDAWWSKSISLEGAGKTLEENAAIYAHLAVISDRVIAFLKSEQLAPIEVEYHTPARFINGKYLPGIIEKYWALLADLRAKEEEHEVLDREARKAHLAARWDSL